ncbi:unnamed protein product, partial [Meganyctiphanes norvegica]
QMKWTFVTHIVLFAFVDIGQGASNIHQASQNIPMRSKVNLKRKLLFQGDILLTSEAELEDILGISKATGRSGVLDRKRLWPKGIIPFVFGRQYNAAEKILVAAAIQEFHRHTCIRFVPWRNTT